MLTLDFQSRLPIYEQLYKNIVRMVAIGVMRPNEQLPTVRSLAQELGVNPNTVQKAYQMLERDRIIYSMTGKGSFVSPDLSAVDHKRSLARDKLTAALLEAADAGMTHQEIQEVTEEFFRKRGEGRHA
ncbi:MAG: GntR family transcriptional regulator [Clostridiales bacterium]|jgi:GntR family transcriptional regulator|nr:GntR family transcriptional regulator [Clostridiales bacterium]